LSEQLSLERMLIGEKFWCHLIGLILFEHLLVEGTTNKFE
jgi:hypothetical protein